MQTTADRTVSEGIVTIRLYNTYSGRISAAEQPAASPLDAQNVYEAFVPSEGWEKYGFLYERMTRRA